MSDEQVLAQVMLRFVSSEYFYLSDKHLTLDGSVTLTAEESQALARLWPE